MLVEDDSIAYTKKRLEVLFVLVKVHVIDIEEYRVKAAQSTDLQEEVLSLDRTVEQALDD